MIIRKIGKYKLVEDWSSRGSRSVKNFPKGKMLEINQIDMDGQKIIGPEFEDWGYWDIPVVLIKERNEGRMR